MTLASHVPLKIKHALEIWLYALSCKGWSESGLFSLIYVGTCLARVISKKQGGPWHSENAAGRSNHSGSGYFLASTGRHHQPARPHGLSVLEAVKVAKTDRKPALVNARFSVEFDTGKIVR